ncbi:MAG: GNAT family N-acetyltransferase [Sphingobacterium sp.]|jgi:RimJ/RimL family protein N-acetyltransferase|nr:GNAT family N-acetyltransferase [Sphingobacterium sp.]
MVYSDRLVFREPTQQDFQRYYEINSDPDTNLYNPQGAMSIETAKKSFEVILAHWESQKFGTWKIMEKLHSDFVIGFGGITFRYYGSELKLNLGYRFDKNYWGKGYATEFALKTIGYAFSILNQKEIYALVRPDNMASIRVLEKSGMLLVDTLHDIQGRDDSLVYQTKKM